VELHLPTVALAMSTVVVHAQIEMATSDRVSRLMQWTRITGCAATADALLGCDQRQLSLFV